MIVSSWYNLPSHQITEKQIYQLNMRGRSRFTLILSCKLTNLLHFKSTSLWFPVFLKSCFRSLPATSETNRTKNVYSRHQVLLAANQAWTNTLENSKFIIIWMMIFVKLSQWRDGFLPSKPCWLCVTSSVVERYIKCWIKNLA